MKITVRELRLMISEEYLRGVPEFVFWEASHRFVKEIRSHVMKFILQHRSDDFLAQREAIEELDGTMDGLEEAILQVLEDKLYEYSQSV